MKDFATIINEAFANAVKEALNQQKAELASMINTLVDEKIAAALKSAPVQSDSNEQFTQKVKEALDDIDLADFISADDLDFDVSEAVDDYLSNSTVEIRIR